MSKKLNKFEKCRLIAARAGELAEGDHANVDVEATKVLSKDCGDIAEKEFQEDKMELEIYHNK